MAGPSFGPPLYLGGSLEHAHPSPKADMLTPSPAVSLATVCPFARQNNEKKWTLVCSQNATATKNPPSKYLDQIISNIEAIQKQKQKKSKTKKLDKGTEPAGKVLRGTSDASHAGDRMLLVSEK